MKKKGISATPRRNRDKSLGRRETENEGRDKKGGSPKKDAANGTGTTQKPGNGDERETGTAGRKMRRQEQGQASGAMRRWKVRRMRSARRRTPNLFRRLETWNFTVRSAMFSLLAISLLERFSSSESRTSCSRRLRLATESDFRRRVWPERIESTKPERTVRGTQKPPVATRGRARMS